MADLKTRFRGADWIPAPHLWEEITNREPNSGPSEPGPARRILVAAFAMVIAVGAITFAVRAIGYRGERPSSQTSPGPAAPKTNGLIYFQRGGGEGGTWTDAIEPDGSSRETVFGRGMYISHIAWSPDGTRIAYVGIVQYGNQSPERQTQFGIFVSNPDGSGAQQLTDGVNEGWPSWSPDGARIAFSSTRGDPAERECAPGGQSSCPTDIYLVNADGSAITRLTDDPSPDYAPAWSPDGARIAFVRTTGDTNEIDAINVDGTGVTRVASGTIAGAGGVEHPFSWSPDGSQIVFTSVAEANWEIHVVNADGTRERKIFGADHVVSEDPIWSPDGTEIAFSSTFGAYPPGCGADSDVCSDLFVMRADGSHVTKLTQESPGVFGIAWQPLPVEASTAVTQSSPPEVTEVSDPLVSVTIKVGDFAAGAIAVGEDAVWLGVQPEGGGDYVARIDPRTNGVVATIPVNSSPWDVAAGAGSVWVTGIGENKSGTLQRIDPATNEVVATITVESSGHPGLVAAGDDAVWVDVGDTESDSLVRIDPVTNRVVATVPLPGPGLAYVDGLQVVGATVWVQETVSTQGGYSDHGGDVIRIDGTTNRVVATIQAHALNMTAGPDAVWVSDRPERQDAGWILSKIDPGTNQIVEGPFSLPDGSGGFGPLCVDQAGVWLDGYDEQERVLLVHVDARTHEIDASSKPIDSYYTGAAFDPTTSSFWVTAPLGSVTRLDMT
jgi:TolB protein